MEETGRGGAEGTGDEAGRDFDAGRREVEGTGKGGANGIIGGTFGAVGYFG